MAMTFFGESRWKKGVHPHESPLVMTAPMIILAIGSVFGGLALKFLGDIELWLEPVVGVAAPKDPAANAVLIPVTLTVVLLGAGYGWLKYAKTPVPALAPENVSLLTRAARADVYGDALNEAVFMRPGQYLTRALVWFDSRAVDGLVGGLSATVGGLSARLRRTQNGLVRSYALTMVGGAVLIALVLLLVRL
jgi:NADH-quinone oxidoreductase subunit L